MVLVQLKISEEIGFFFLQRFLSYCLAITVQFSLTVQFSFRSPFVEAKFIIQNFVKCACLFNDPFHARNVNLSLLELHEMNIYTPTKKDMSAE